MPIKKISDEIYNNLTACFDTLSAISYDKTGSVSLIDLPDMELNFDDKFIPKHYPNLTHTKLVDTILPRKCGLYLIEFKNETYKGLDTGYLKDKARDSLEIIEKYFETTSLNNIASFVVFYGKKENKPNRNSEKPIVKTLLSQINNGTSKDNFSYSYQSFKKWYN